MPRRFGTHPLLQHVARRRVRAAIALLARRPDLRGENAATAIDIAVRWNA